MLKGKFKKTCLPMAVLISLSAAPVLGAGNGATPKGKPFVALEGQIVEVQGAVTTLEDQVAELIGQVDSIETRLAANEQAIVDLNVENDAINTLITGAYTSIYDINMEIEALSVDIDVNAGLISTLQATIASVEAGQIDLAQNLQDQIDNNFILIGFLEANIVAINDFIEADQHIAAGTCPAGEYVIGHTTNSVSCSPIDGGGDSTIQGYFTFARSPSFGRNVQAYCHLPTDIRTGGGFNAIQTNHSVRRSTPTGINGWTVELTGNNRDVQAYVMCLRVN